MTFGRFKITDTIIAIIDQNVRLKRPYPCKCLLGIKTTPVKPYDIYLSIPCQQLAELAGYVVILLFSVNGRSSIGPTKDKDYKVKGLKEGKG